VVTLGGCDLAVREAIGVLAAQGIKADYMRVRGFPFAKSVETFLNQHEEFRVEQNRDGQLTSLLTLETGVKKEKLARIVLRRISAERQTGSGRHSSVISHWRNNFAIDSETYSNAPELTTE
jgi:hypothetical protein